MISYRPDVDGIRAISILVVLLFHIGFDDWSGGYVGVDVFFVISGFLITSLITSDLAAGQFSFLKFFERRVRRLLPASVPVVLFTTLFAWAFYTTERFHEYAGSLIAFATYTSNWFFLSTRGYFAGADASTPLLHTWSLAVEEQFYIVFPVLLWMIYRHASSFRFTLCLLAFASLAHAQALLWSGKTDLAFFSTFTRFWELMAGALLALTPSVSIAVERYATLLRMTGIALIFCAVFLYSPATLFPGLAAVPPVAGALLLLVATPRRGDFILNALQWPPIVYVGRISYPLYLWHWPIFGAMKVVVFEPNDLHKVLAIALSFVAAALTYRYIEQPIRQRTFLPHGRSLVGLFGTFAGFCIAVGAYGWQTGGWPGRMSPEVEQRASIAAVKASDPQHCFNTGNVSNVFCRPIPPIAPVDIVVWGDSHAHALTPALRKFTADHHVSIAYALRGDCAPLTGIWRQKDVTHACRRFNDEALKFVAELRPRLVVMAAWWSNYTSGRQLFLDDRRAARSGTESRLILEDALNKTLDQITATGAKIVIVEQVPQNAGDVPSASIILHRLGLPANTIAATRTAHQKRQQFITSMLDRASAARHLTRLDPAGPLCQSERCTVEADGRLLYFDNDHLNDDGSLFLYPWLASELDKALAANTR
jgi:peptidoglycan/LPS O-acetylase OafA/YrhL